MDTSPTVDSDGSTTQAKPRCNSLYYLDCLVFLVEGDLFKVPRFRFNNSSLFKTIFTLPPGETVVEGTSDEHPFELHGIKKDDFECLMKVLYPLTLACPCLQIGGWISVLELSTMWELHEARALAIQELSGVKMNTVDKILLAKEYSVTEWLLAGYTEVVQQEEKLSIEDASRLGWETATRLFRVREACGVMLARLWPGDCTCRNSIDRGYRSVVTTRCEWCGVNWSVPRKLGDGLTVTAALQAEFSTELEEVA